MQCSQILVSLDSQGRIEAIQKHFCQLEMNPRRFESNRSEALNQMEPVESKVKIQLPNRGRVATFRGHFGDVQRALDNSLSHVTHSRQDNVLIKSNPSKVPASDIIGICYIPQIAMPFSVLTFLMDSQQLHDSLHSFPLLGLKPPVAFDRAD